MDDVTDDMIRAVHRTAPSHWRWSDDGLREVLAAVLAAAPVPTVTDAKTCPICNQRMTAFMTMGPGRNALCLACANDIAAARARPAPTVTDVERLKARIAAHQAICRGGSAFDIADAVLEAAARVRQENTDG